MTILVLIFRITYAMPRCEPYPNPRLHPDIISLLLASPLYHHPPPPRFTPISSPSNLVLDPATELLHFPYDASIGWHRGGFLQHNRSYYHCGLVCQGCSYQGLDHLLLCHSPGKVCYHL